LSGPCCGAINYFRRGGGTGSALRSMAAIPIDVHGWAPR
jgi:hypothetical protein